MGNLNKSVELAALRLTAIFAIAIGTYLFTNRLVELSNSTAGSLAMIAGKPDAGKTPPRLPSDAELNQLNALSQRIDMLRQNLANTDTVGYKRRRMMVNIGPRGEVSNIVQFDQNQGSLKASYINTDVGISGEGFLRIKLPPNIADGTGYTRTGNLYRDKDGDLVVGTGPGYRLIPVINIPPGATDLAIAQDGKVTCTPRGSATKCAIGQISLYRFANAQGLSSDNGIIFTETDLSGPSMAFTPGEGGTGQLLQGYRESSNVNSLSEQVALLKAEQQYDLGCKPIRAAMKARQTVAIAGN